MIRSLTASALVLSLTACGSHSTPSTPVVAAAPGSATSDGYARATLAIDVPAAKTVSAGKRLPDYVSPKTAAIGVVLANPPAGFVQPAIAAVTPGSGICPVDPSNPGFYKCTLTLQIPPGSDTLTITTYAGATASSAILSQQIQTIAVAAGAANAFSVTLDAAPATLVASVTGGCTSPVFPAPANATLYPAQNVPTVISLAALDAAGASLAGPGLPTIAVNGVTSSGTLSSGAATAGVTIDQVARTVTISAVQQPAAALPVTIVERPANSTGASDGLTGSVTGSFTLEVGLPPTPASVLAVALAGSPTTVHLYTAAASGFGDDGAFATTAATNLASAKDVDAPRALLFDPTGDLLIANGGAATAADTGNLACVPAGVVQSGAADATAVTFDANDPVGIAYDARDQSVALANAAPAATLSLAEYTPQQTYALASAAGRSIARGSSGGATAVTALPMLAAGSYAEAITNAVPSGKTGAASKVAIQVPGAAEYDVMDAGTLDVPKSLGVDPVTNQLVVGNQGNATTQYLSYYTVTATSATRTARVSTGLNNTAMAISSNGTVAIAGAYSPEPQVALYSTAGVRMGGPIPFNGTQTPFGSDYLYDANGGGDGAVTSLQWISPTLLVVGLQSSLTTAQGLYLYDTAQTAVPAGFDDVTGLAFLPTAKQTAFLETAGAPLAIAFKP